MLRWSFTLLDSEDRPLRALDGASGGRWQIDAGTLLGGSASIVLNVKAGGDIGIDWTSDRVRARFHDGADSYDVGTYLFTSPTQVNSGEGVTGYTVDLLSKMNIPSEDKLESRFAAVAGLNVVNTVITLLNSTGETRIAATPSPSQVRSVLTWDAGTPKLTVINDLLQSIGYWSLWCDGTGLFRVEPYVRPADRPVSYNFEHGEQSVHFPDWQHKQDITSVPNKFIAVSARSGDDPPLVGVAKNVDPASPYSYQNRGKNGQGRWITDTETGIEAESQSVIDQIANRRLADRMSPVSKFRVRHAMLPLNRNDLVSFTPADGARRLATVQSMQGTFDPFTDVDAEWRGV